MRNILAVMAVIGCISGCASFQDTCKSVLDSAKTCMSKCAQTCAGAAIVEGLGKCKLPK